MHMDKSISDLTSKFKRLNKRYSEMVNLTLKNAYLMPSDLRDKAQIYLESLENDFKVGLFGSKKKTEEDRKSTRLNSSHVAMSYAVVCLKKKTKRTNNNEQR